MGSTAEASTNETIWSRRPSVEELNAMGKETIARALGIEFTEVRDDALLARMPVDERTHQPFGLLHGGASVVLAETIGSAGGYCCAEEGYACVGIDVNANHLRAVRNGYVTATGRPVHLGRRTQVWQIDLHDDAGRHVCTSRLTLAVVEAR